MLVGGAPGLAAGGTGGGVAAGLQLEPREAGRATASHPRGLAAPVPGAPWASATPPVPCPPRPPTNTVPPPSPPGPQAAGAQLPQSDGLCRHLGSTSAPLPPALGRRRRQTSQ